MDIVYFVRAKGLGGLTMVFAGEIVEKKKPAFGREGARGLFSACLKRVRKKWGAAKEDVPQRLKPQDKTGLMARLKPCP